MRIVALIAKTLTVYQIDRFLINAMMGNDYFAGSRIDTFDGKEVVEF